jgi:hypothetical protein
LVLVLDFWRWFASFIVFEPTVFGSSDVFFLADIAKHFHSGFKRSGHFVFIAKATWECPLLGSGDIFDGIQLQLR